MRLAPAIVPLLVLVATARRAGAQGAARASGPAAPAPAAPAFTVVKVAAELELTLGPGTEHCPGEERLHAEVSRRLGYDPFAADANGRRLGRMRTTVARIPAKGSSPEGIDATTEYVDAAGVRQWTRRYPVPGTSARACAVAISGAAANIADQLTIIDDPPAEPPSPPPPPPKRPEPACPEPKAEPAPACSESPSVVWPTEPLPPPLRAPKPDPPKPPEVPLAFRFGAGVWADLISNDRGSLGLTLDAGVRYRWFSTAIEARGDPALGSTTYANYGSVRFARMTGAVLLCGHYGWFAGCVKGQAGEILFPGTSPPQSPKLYAAAGVRLGLEFPVTPWFLVRLDGEVLPPIDPAIITVQKATVFEVAGWNAGLGLGALFSVGKL